jgi:hypothetical protein
MKIPVGTAEDIAHFCMDTASKERSRRIEKYGKIIDDRLLNLLPMFRMTHSQRARKCFMCDKRIAQLEIHFVLNGTYVCQRDCTGGRRRPPALRLIIGGMSTPQTTTPIGLQPPTGANSITNTTDSTTTTERNRCREIYSKNQR